MSQIDYRTLGLLGLILVLGAFFGFAAGRTVGSDVLSSAADIDSRSAIEVTPKQMVTLGASMRSDLEAMQAIQSALAAGDRDAVAKAASRRGGEAVKPDPALQARLGSGWRSKEAALRDSFDQIAADAQSGQSTETILAETAQLTNGCISCHQAYHLVMPKPL